jgi:hypothetical protein
MSRRERGLRQPFSFDVVRGDLAQSRVLVKGRRERPRAFLRCCCPRVVVEGRRERPRADRADAFFPTNSSLASCCFPAPLEVCPLRVPAYAASRVAFSSCAIASRFRRARPARGRLEAHSKVVGAARPARSETQRVTNRRAAAAAAAAALLAGLRLLSTSPCACDKTRLFTAAALLALMCSAAPARRTSAALALCARAAALVQRRGAPRRPFPGLRCRAHRASRPSRACGDQLQLGVGGSTGTRTAAALLRRPLRRLPLLLLLQLLLLSSCSCCGAAAEGCRCCSCCSRRCCSAAPAVPPLLALKPGILLLLPLSSF